MRELDESGEVAKARKLVKPHWKTCKKSPRMKSGYIQDERMRYYGRP
jgi:hypothetical protein